MSEPIKSGGGPAFERFKGHRDGCDTCRNSNVLHGPFCVEGKSLFDAWIDEAERSFERNKLLMDRLVAAGARLDEADEALRFAVANEDELQRRFQAGACTLEELQTAQAKRWSALEAFQAVEAEGEKLLAESTGGHL